MVCPISTVRRSDVVAAQPPIAGTVHVWWADLLRPDAPKADVHGVHSVETRSLSVEERGRAERFGNKDLRRRFIAARSHLRLLLGRYLEMDPAEIALGAGPHGKPRLAGRDPSLRFNLSHAGDLAVYAFAWEREVGVDVECVQPVPEWRAVADAFFPRSERAALERVAPTHQTDAFLGAWTRQEALLKAIGRGWGGPCLPPSAKTAGFSFCALEAPPGVAAALAIEGPPAVAIVCKGAVQ
jgi:4'-phosphopantetheinyl transferase